jgi:DNA ligase (NAD+)
VGDIVAEALVAAGWVRSPLDLYELPAEKLGGLLLGDGQRKLGDKTAATILAAVARSRQLPLPRWLHAMGIPEVGETTAKELARFHPDFTALANSPLIDGVVRLAELSARAEEINPQKRGQELSQETEFRQILTDFLATSAQLSSSGFIHLEVAKPTARLSMAAFPKVIFSVGPAACRSLQSYFASAAGQDVCHRLQALGLNPAADKTNASTTLVGQIFVITGTLSRPRNEFVRLIEAAGGKTTGSVSSKTNYLLAGENAGSKLTEAQRLGVTILTEDAFFQLIK